MPSKIGSLLGKIPKPSSPSGSAITAMKPEQASLSSPLTAEVKRNTCWAAGEVINVSFDEVMLAESWKMYTSGASLLIYYKGELGLQS